MDSDISLSPLLEKEFISRTENEEELSEKYKINVPVYAEFEGNLTIFVEFSVHSGFKALPFFFIYTIPWEPRYGWKAYAGEKKS